MTTPLAIPHTRRHHDGSFRMRFKPLAALVCSLMAVSTNPAIGAAAGSTTSPDDACAHFAPQNLPHGATVTKTEARAAQGVCPQACIDRGTIVPAPTSTLTWAGELPARDLWNGKTLTFGGSGFDGFTPTDADYYHIMAGPLHAPYARMGSDSGHQVRSFYPWALDDAALKNHAFEANHLT